MGISTGRKKKEKINRKIVALKNLTNLQAHSKSDSSVACP
jgi:hypothetical protein